MFCFLVAHHCRLYWKAWFSLLQPFLFFSLVLLLFHLFIKDQQVFSRLIPVLVMICLLLAHLLSLDSLFKTSLASGIIDQVFLSRQHAYVVLLSMTLAHWINHGFLLSILALPWVLSSFLTLEQMLIITLIWLLFTANLTLIGMFTSALTAAVNENSLLLSLISMPLYLPNLIFSFESYQAVLGLVFVSSSFLFLAALFCFYLAILPFAAYVALANSNA